MRIVMKMKQLTAGKRKAVLPAVMALALVMVLTSGLAGCGAPVEEQPEEQISYEIAMVTDSGIIMDGGYKETAWNAISAFGAEQGISHKYYKAADATDEAYMAAIDSAVAKGAKVIVADGYSFENVVYDAQTLYEDVKFILMDAEPTEAETGQAKIEKNTTAVLFASEQAGYLAGYAAVMDGMTELGFMGAAKKPAVINYGYGFLQGAEAAAAEVEAEGQGSKNEGSKINVKYYYCTGEDDREAILEKASEWYKAGTQAIFACGADVEMPVIEAAELTDKKVIGCETDKSGMSDTVITSAVKDIGGALEAVLEQYKADEFPGGEAIRYDASNDGIRLEMDNARFLTFEKAASSKVFDGIAKGEIAVAAYDIGDLEGLKLERVNVIL